MTNKNRFEVAVSGKWTGGVQTAIQVRDFEAFLIDEPANLGGKDEGPNPVEFVLAGLNGCVSVMIAIIAKEMQFAYTAVTFDTKGTLDVRGLMGVPDVTPNFQTVTLNVSIATQESQERIDELMEKVESRCPVMTMIKGSGVQVDGEWKAAI